MTESSTWGHTSRRGAWHRGGRGATPLDLHEGVLLTVDHQGRDLERAQRLGAVTGGMDGQQLAGHTARVV